MVWRPQIELKVTCYVMLWLVIVAKSVSFNAIILSYDMNMSICLSSELLQI